MCMYECMRESICACVYEYLCACICVRVCACTTLYMQKSEDNLHESILFVHHVGPKD